MSKNNRKNVNEQSSKHRNNGGFGRLMISLIILGVVILLFVKFALPMLKSSAKKVAAEKTVDVLIENADKISGGNEQVTQVLESMTEEDKEIVSEIIENHMDAESVSEVMEYVNDGDKEGLMKYATENLTPEEIEKLAELYGKYGQ